MSCEHDLTVATALLVIHDQSPLASAAACIQCATLSLPINSPLPLLLPLVHFLPRGCCCRNRALWSRSQCSACRKARRRHRSSSSTAAKSRIEAGQQQLWPRKHGRCLVRPSHHPCTRMAPLAPCETSSLCTAAAPVSSTARCAQPLAQTRHLHMRHSCHCTCGPMHGGCSASTAMATPALNKPASHRAGTGGLPLWQSTAAATGATAADPSHHGNSAQEGSRLSVWVRCRYEHAALSGLSAPCGSAAARLSRQGRWQKLATQQCRGGSAQQADGVMQAPVQSEDAALHSCLVPAFAAFALLKIAQRCSAVSQGQGGLACSVSPSATQPPHLMAWHACCATLREAPSSPAAALKAGAGARKAGQ
eukprot:TRINITY_DN352_c2_g1_i1.p1 TRINITY_DN352_c2_g1~~TRINITY_DN352_c2_g1_i1.p1  ORF type:complete len:364 (+),score=31.09 TRINITY_DN352_c2_g1_i1:282-1373(+)